MDFPFDIETLLKPDNYGFSIIESQAQITIADHYFNYLSEILNKIGKMSSIDRHTPQITSPETFFN